MSEVVSMEEIRAISDRLGVDLTQVDLDSIQLPPGDNLGIPRSESCTCCCKICSFLFYICRF